MIDAKCHGFLSVGAPFRVCGSVPVHAGHTHSCAKRRVNSLDSDDSCAGTLHLVKDLELLDLFLPVRFTAAVMPVGFGIGTMG